MISVQLIENKNLNRSNPISLEIRNNEVCIIIILSFQLQTEKGAVKRYESIPKTVDLKLIN